MGSDPESGGRVLEHADGFVRVEDTGSGRRRVRVELRDRSAYSSRLSVDTTYPDELIEEILRLKGPAWLCDEIARDTDPGYVEHDLRFAILPFIDPAGAEGKRMLDFGCGCGASTMALRRLLPRTEIVGIELEEDLLRIARLRARHYGADVRLERSPSPDALPPDIGTFDFICFSAVYEHLLPAERRRLLPQLWSLLKPGGILFINGTPHRWSVIESHTTGLPLLNFVPDRLAHRIATRLSPRVEPDASWPRLLRDGIRGGTPREIRDDLARAGRPRFLEPWRMGIRSEVDLWYAHGAPTRGRRLARAAFRLANRFAGGGYLPYISLAVQKEA